jgi:hypothetical protein
MQEHGEEVERRGAREEWEAGFSGSGPISAVPVAEPRAVELLPELAHLLPLLMIHPYIQLALLLGVARVSIIVVCLIRW